MSDAHFSREDVRSPGVQARVVSTVGVIQPLSSSAPLPAGLPAGEAGRKDGGEVRWAVLPVKPFEWAKSRLEPVMTPAERSAMARGLMLGSLDALVESACFERIVVISRDAEALALAAEAGAYPMTEEAPANLNSALETVRAIALQEGATSFLVLASDLPLVQPDDIRHVVDALDGSGSVIVPDRRSEGTNALLLRPPDAIPYAFGIGSFQRHLSLLTDAGVEAKVLRVEGIAFDVDVPQDLDELEGASNT
jgi:2-phospho-L-lactate guanylyltransferase